MKIPVTLRNWEVGEEFLVTGACVECKAGEGYLLTRNDVPGSWKECITNKINCFGGYDIGPAPGYWRTSNTSENFIECLYSPACLGYNKGDNNDNTGTCFEGYSGTLWSDWKPGYSRQGEYECAKWPNPLYNVIRLILLATATTVWNIINIRSALMGALERKDLKTVYFRILTNHFQLIVLAASFDFRWPSMVSSFFDVTKSTGEASSHILSWDWFFDQREGDNDDQTIRIYYIKMFIFAILPVVLAVLSYLFWTIYFCFKKSELQKKTGRIVSTLIITFFTIHPTIVSYMFSNFR